MLNMVSQTPETESDGNGRKTWKNILIDSAIIGGIAVFATIGSMAPTWETVWIAFKAFGAAFLFQLAVERRLKRPLKDAD